MIIGKRRACKWARDGAAGHSDLVRTESVPNAQTAKPTAQGVGLIGGRVEGVVTAGAVLVVVEESEEVLLVRE